MSFVRYAAILLAFGTANTAHAQSGMDWSGIMHAEAMGSAMQEAAREGAESEAAPPARARTRATVSDAETKANCARVRGWIAEGKTDPALPQLAGLCRQLGY